MLSFLNRPVDKGMMALTELLYGEQLRSQAFDNYLDRKEKITKQVAARYTRGNVAIQDERMDISLYKADWAKRKEAWMRGDKDWLTRDLDDAQD